MPVPIIPGEHRLGPENGSLRIETKRGGAAAKAGHDLEFEVASWHGTLSVADEEQDIRLELSADSGSLQVTKGTGGIMELTEEDKVEIKNTLESDVLPAGRVEFQSTQMTPSDDGQRLAVSGELSMNGNRHPLEFELVVDPDGKVSGQATVKQSEWGMTPYSGLFGTLKVKDDVTVIGHASLDAA
jgi:polyisoprenoid-binding protein YceI